MRYGLGMFPERPDVPEQFHVRGRARLRYEDVAQDGRLILAPLPHIVSVAWQHWLGLHAPRRDSSDVVPVLSRLCVDSTDEPILLTAPLEVTGCVALGHNQRTARGAERIFLNMWVEARGTRGRLFDKREASPQPVLGGRVFAEHVFTRPFAPPGQRKVDRLDFEGLPDVPPDELPWHPSEALLDPPADFQSIDEELLPAGEIVFGLHDTDSNQHVNSLVYPRLFERACLQRMESSDRGTRLLSRSIEIRYRKPCFAGERHSMWVRLGLMDGDPAAICALGNPNKSQSKAHCTAFLRFS